METLASPLEEFGSVCHACGDSPLELEPVYADLCRVTSDSKPWRLGGQLARCGVCGLAQAVVDAHWRAEVEAIYADYSIYHMADGVEQGVRSADRGMVARSEVVAGHLLELGVLPSEGRALDVGCGNGAFLRALSDRLSAWQLWGLEWDDRHRERVMGIRGVQGLHVGDLAHLALDFDLVSLVHVLEHIPGPAAYLARLRDHLTPEGLILIEVPDCEANPFALLIADHASHFSLESLTQLVAAQGYEIVCATRVWAARELSVVARKTPAKPRPLQGGAVTDRVLSGANWLLEVREQARHVALGEAWGIFGTSIAAVFVDRETGQTARFFVDEDPSRVGRTFLGRPILHPRDVCPGQTLFVALPPAIAARVLERIALSGVTYVHPAVRDLGADPT